MTSRYRPTLAVTGAAASTDLITTAQLLQALNGGTPPDPATLVTEVTAVIEGYCYTQFARQAYLETWYDSPGHCDFRLRRHPVTSITQITDTDAAVIPATDYELVDPEVGRIRFYESSHLSAATRFKLSITYEAGYDPIPADLQQAAMSVGQALFSSVSVNPLAASERIDDYEITYAGAGAGGTSGGAIARLNIPQLYRQVLDRYRILNLW